MARIIGNPGRYIQGKGEIGNLAGYIEHFGKSLFLIISGNGKARFEKDLERGLADKDFFVNYEIFQGECCKEYIAIAEEHFKESGCQVVIGMGGGKVLDTAKAVAAHCNAPLVIIPTTAAQDAPCLACSVLYDLEGRYDEIWTYNRNPDVVLVDSQIISNSPLRLFAAGLGDGLATLFDGKACLESNALNGLGGYGTKTSEMMMHLCYDIIMEDGLKAYQNVKDQIVSRALENVIEANIYLSGIGAEGMGDGAAHGIHNGFTVLEETKAYYHGEIVSFGILVQAFLENDSMDFIDRIALFMSKVGLPITLADIGVDRADKGKLMKVAEASALDSVSNMPFVCTPEDIYGAMIAADSYGRSFKGKCPDCKVI